MSDYTDISSRAEDIKEALNSLYELIYSQYDGVFRGEDLKKYQRMMRSIRNADKCMDEVSDINDRLSDTFKENLDRL